MLFGSVGKPADPTVEKLRGVRTIQLFDRPRELHRADNVLEGDLIEIGRASCRERV